MSARENFELFNSSRYGSCFNSILLNFCNFSFSPKTTKDKILAVIKQGKLTKEKAADKIAKKIKDKFHFPVSRQEIMQAIPSDKLSVS